jgi:hypothetical protein
MDYYSHNAHDFMKYCYERFPGYSGGEVLRINNLLETLMLCHENKSVVLHVDPTSGNLFGLSRIEIIDGIALETALQFMITENSLRYEGENIWDCKNLTVCNLDPTFNLWQVWFTFYRLGFKPSNASSKIANEKRVWYHVFIGITEWTSVANTLPRSDGQSVYYASMTQDESSLHIVNSTYQAGLQWTCEECKGTITSTEILPHVKVCNQPYGRRSKPQHWDITNVGHMPFPSDYSWDTPVSVLDSIGVSVDPYRYPFRPQEFPGPPIEECKLVRQFPTTGEITCLALHARMMDVADENEKVQWVMCPFNND